MNLVLLKNICNPKQWKTISISELDNNGFPVFGANGIIGYYSKYNHEKPTLLITCRGATCGEVNISLPFSYINGNAMALDNLNEEIANIKFLYYYFKNKGFTNIITGSAQPQIIRENLNNLQIPLPPLPKQKRIAEILDRADELRQKRKKSIELLDVYLKSTFYNMFGDPVKNEKGWDRFTLSEVCGHITDGSHNSPPLHAKGIPYITAKHIKLNKIVFFDDPTYVSLDDHKKIYLRCKPEKGDILYIKDGATTGIAAINPFDFEFSMLSSLALLKPKYKKITSEYLCNWLNSERVKSILVNNMSGVAIKRFTLEKIKFFFVLLPPLPIQLQFSKIVKQVEKTKTKMQESLKELDNLFNSLMQKAFKN
ncbi:MAG: restriction endonuclease subunit S [Ignavibacteria bacterium]|nr:restriction endonuclease subunit S [Ignavibacteria bacterium]